MSNDKKFILEVPCGVQETVYIVADYATQKEVLKCKTVSLYLTGHNEVEYLLVDDEDGREIPYIVCVEDFGETVFFTKEEAEAKLKEAGEQE